MSARGTMVGRVVRCTVLVLFLPRSADARPLQLGVHALVSTPVWDFPGSGLSAGPGLEADAALGVMRNVLVGARIAAYVNEDGCGSCTHQYELVSLPMQVILRYSKHSDSLKRLFAQVGAGVMEERRLRGSEWSAGDTVTWQLCPAVHASAGFGIPIAHRVLLRFSLGFDAAFAPPGGIWRQGEVPRFVLLAVGVAYES